MQRKFKSMDMVAHTWAQQTQPYGKSGNMYFDGKAIFSYGSHFPIATFIKNKQGEKKVLWNDDGYSPSTSNHKDIARSACSHYERLHTNTTIIKLVVSFSHTDYFKKALVRDTSEYISKLIASQAKIAIKRRKPELKASDIGVALSSYEHSKELLEFFDCKMPVSVTKLAAVLETDLEAVVTKHEKEIAAAKRKLLAAAKKAEKERESIAIKAAPLWIAGEDLDYISSNALYNTKFVYLRIAGDTIQTSHNASFPVDHAKRAFTAIRDCKESNREWKRNGHSIHLGNFAIDNIDNEGNVTAGCHHVKWNEIERIAKALEVY